MSIETQLAVIEQELDQSAVVISKLDKAIEKIADVTADISKILAVHEQRLDRGEQATAQILQTLETRRQEMNEDIKELHSRITTTTRELSTEISETENRIISGIEDLKKELKADQIFHNDKQRDLDSRITALERWRYMLVGAGILGGFIITKALDIISIMK
jgi:ABC-type transporter Mla subunit MlaD